MIPRSLVRLAVGLIVVAACRLGEAGTILFTQITTGYSVVNSRESLNGNQIFAVSTPSVSGSNVAYSDHFQHFGNTPSHSSVYLHSNGVRSTVATIGTPIPGTSQSFKPLSLGGPTSVSGSTVGFEGSGPPYGPIGGLYRFNGGQRSVVADENSAIPDGSGTFTDFSNVNISGSNSAFLGYGFGGQRGVYKDFGSDLETVADIHTPLSGGDRFNNFLDVNLSGSNVSFMATTRNNNAGVFANSGAGLRTIADKQTLQPGAGGAKFSTFVSSSMSGADVAFVAGSFGVGGVYLARAGTLLTIADTNTSIPDGIGKFTNFSYSTVAVSGINVVFLGFGAGSVGLYGYINGQLIRIIDNQFRLNGSPVTSLALGSMGFDGSTLGFAAKTGQGWGIYRADFSRFGDMPGRDTFAGGAPSVPEPSTFLSMAIGAVGLVILRRRVKAKA